MKMKNTVLWNLWDTAKAALQGKFIGLNEYVRKEEKPQINNLISHLKNLEREEQHSNQSINQSLKKS